MIKILKEHSYRYLATIFQLTGIACTSAFGTKLFNAASIGDLAELNPKLLSFQLCLVLLIVGIGLVGVGWFIMYLVDLQRSEPQGGREL